MARTYNRDSRGRFASGGGGSSNRGPVKVGRAGPRGGKVGTRAEQRRAAQDQAARTKQFSSKTSPSAMRDAWKASQRALRSADRSTRKGRADQAERTARFQSKATGPGRDARASYKAQMGAARAGRKGGALANQEPIKVNATPMPGRGQRQEPRVADVMRENLRLMAQSDARFIRGVEQITGQPIRIPKATTAPRISGSGSKSESSSGGSGKVAADLRNNLRQLAQADARRMRELDDLLKSIPSAPKGISGSKRSSAKALPGSTSRRRKPQG
jgi:hypothetical protein